MASRRRIWAGLAGFAALEAAVFARYTDIVVLGCAVAAVTAAWRLRMLPRTALGWWPGSAAVFAAGLATFDGLVYGGPLKSGYRPGEITFSLAAIPRNLRFMPDPPLGAIPMLVPGIAALAWIAGRQVRLRRAGGNPRPAPPVTSPWAWPWLLVRIRPRGWSGALVPAAAVLVLAGLGLWSFTAMRADPMGGMSHRGGPHGQVAHAAGAAAVARAGHHMPHPTAVPGTSRNVPVSYKT